MPIHSVPATLRISALGDASHHVAALRISALGSPAGRCVATLSRVAGGALSRVAGGALLRLEGRLVVWLIRHAHGVVLGGESSLSERNVSYQALGLWHEH